MATIKKIYKCTGCGTDRSCVLETNQEASTLDFYSPAEDLKCVLDSTNQTSYNWKEISSNITDMICPECQEVVCDDDCSNPRYKKLELATVDVGVSFITFWDLYDKKIGKPKCEKKWDKLPVKERKAILDYIPLYIKSQPDKKFRKNPETFLNNRSWEDELLFDKVEPNSLDKLSNLFS